MLSLERWRQTAHLICFSSSHCDHSGRNSATILSTQMSGDMATDHVNGNGTEEPMDTTAEVTRSEHFPALLEAGLPQNVAEKLDELYVAGKKLLLLSVVQPA